MNFANVREDTKRRVISTSPSLQAIVINKTQVLLHTNEKDVMIELDAAQIVINMVRELANPGQSQTIEQNKLVEFLLKIGALRGAEAVEPSRQRYTRADRAHMEAQLDCIPPGQRRVCVVHNGALGEKIAASIGEHGSKAETLDVRVDTSRWTSPQDYIGTAIERATTSSKTEMHEALADASATAPIFIIALEGVPFGAVCMAIEKLVAQDAICIPVTIRANRLDIGPTMVRGSNLLDLYEVRFGLPSEASLELRRASDRILVGTSGNIATSLLDTATSIVARLSQATLGGRLTRSMLRLCDDWFEQIEMLGRRIEGEESKHISLSSYLREGFEHADVRQELRELINKGELIVIRNAFAEEFAEEIHRYLDTTKKWKLHQEFYPGFHFHHHNLYDQQECLDEMAAITTIFSSRSTHDLVGELTGMGVHGTTVSASWYMPGDYSTPHSDDDLDRRIAFVWHLTKNWDPAWGGDLYWCGVSKRLKPEFNTLYLFRTDAPSDHFVMPVAPIAGGKRLTVNGWWLGPPPADAGANSKKRLIAFRDHDSFLTTAK